MRFVQFCCSFFFLLPVFLFQPQGSYSAEIGADSVSVFLNEKGVPTEHQLYKKSFALVVGGDFNDPGTGGVQLYSPENDALAVYNLLRGEYRFDEILFLRGKSATKESILSSFDSLAGKANFDDSVFIFLGLHAFTQKEVVEDYSYLTGEPEIAELLACVDTTITRKSSALIPYGGSARSDQSQNNISVDSLYRKILDIKAKHLYLIFDAPVIYPGLERSVRISSEEFFASIGNPGIPNLSFSVEMCSSYLPGSCYLNKVRGVPGRQILMPSGRDALFLKAQSGGHPPFIIKLLSALQRERDFTSANQIWRRMAGELSGEKTGSKGFSPVNTVVYGGGDFVFSRKPEKVIAELEAEIAHLGELSQKSSSVGITSWDDQYPLIRFDSILDWSSLLYDIARKLRPFGQVLWDALNGKTKGDILAGNTLVESEKRAFLKQLNDFIRNNRMLETPPDEGIEDGNEETEEDENKELEADDDLSLQDIEVEYVTGVQLVPEAKELFEKGYEILTEEEHSLLNRLILESLYPGVFFKKPEDFMAHALQLESMKAFMQGTPVREEFIKEMNLVSLSKKEEEKIDFWVTFNHLECEDMLSDVYIPSYREVFLCMDSIKKLIQQETSEVNRKRTNEIRRMRKEFAPSIFAVGRPKELFESAREHAYRKKSVEPVLRLGMDRRIKGVQEKYDLHLENDITLNRLKKMLQSFSELEFFLFDDDFEVDYLRYKKGRGAVPVTITAEPPRLSILSRTFDLFVPNLEWETLQKETKRLNVRLKYHFSPGRTGQSVFPELVASYVVDAKSHLRRELMPPFQYVQGGCFYKSWLLKESDLKVAADTLYCVDDFYMGRYEVTGTEYTDFSGIKNIAMNMYDHPISGVDWNAAHSYCSSLGSKFGGQYRLPTKTEWEYVASLKGRNRGFITGGDALERGAVNIRGKDGNDTWGWTAPVGSLKPDSFGIYELGGNVSEWVQDWYTEESQYKGVLVNYQGGSSGKYRSVKGGGWSTDAPSLLMASDKKWNPILGNGVIGFRCVRSYEKY